MVMRCERIDMINKLFMAALIAAFIPYSWLTPLGYVSIVDCSVFIFFVASSAHALSRGVIHRQDFSVVTLSFVAYCLIFLAQALNGVVGDVSILIKYFVFLIVMPLGLAFSGLPINTRHTLDKIPRVLSIAGTVMSFVVLFQICRGAVRAGGGAYYIEFFGQFVNKNGLALTLMFGVLGSAICAIVRKSRVFGAMCVFQLAITFYIGARAATLVDILLIQVIYFYFSKITMARMVFYILAMSFAAMSIFVLAESGLAGDQIQRLIQVANTDTSTVTASTSRILLWLFALNEIGRSPWLGSGYGTFSYGGGGWLDGMYEPHNNILQITYSGGVIGLSAFLVLIVMGMRKGFMRRSSQPVAIILSGYLLSTLVDIIWVRGDGHIFWLMFFLVALAPKASIVNDSSKISERDDLMASRPELAPCSAKKILGNLP